MTADAIRYLRLWKELQRCDAADAEAVADRMDGSWYAMAPPERDRVRGIIGKVLSRKERRTRLVFHGAEGIKWESLV